MEVRRVEVAGHGGPIELSVAEAGPGGRPLVLVHGFTGAKEDVTRWLDPLAERGWHAVAPDQRGHGDSDKPADESAYSFEGFAHDLLGLFDALGWASAVVLGHSMGGMVAQMVAIQAPHRVDALVLMDTSHRALRAEASFVELAISIARTDGMGALLAAQEALPEQDQPLANEIARRLQEADPDYKAFGERKMLASSPAMYAAMLRALTDRAGGVDRLDALRGVRVPTLVVVGEHDAPFVRPSRRMADAIPGARLEVVPDAAHSPQFENPGAWWAAVTGFLDALEPAEVEPTGPEPRG